MLRKTIIRFLASFFISYLIVAFIKFNIYLPDFTTNERALIFLESIFIFIFITIAKKLKDSF